MITDKCCATRTIPSLAFVKEASKNHDFELLCSMIPELHILL